jgi:hypothetical protein
MSFDSMRAGAAFAAFVAVCLSVQNTQAAGHFFAPEQESASAAIAADSDGGLHAAHTGYDGPTKDIVYYRYCGSGCTDPQAWATAELSVPNWRSPRKGLPAS